MSFTEAPLYHYVMMAVGWPSLALYFLVILTIFKSRKHQPAFSSHFYTMILAQSIPCIVLFLYLELMQRPRKYGFYGIYLFEPQLHSPLAQLIAVWKPEKYAQIWTMRWTVICVATYWVASAFIVAPTLFMPFANISYVPNRLAYGLDVFMDARTEYQSATASLCIFATTFLSCSVIYAATFAHLISLKMRMKADLKRNIPRSSELLQLTSSFIMFTSLIFDAGDNVIRIASTISGDGKMLAFAYDLWYLTTETMCISPPWSLLLASPLMRRQVFALLAFMKPMRTYTESSSRRQT